jgi:tRNA1(Val) A37 N6-methylase TrmN6
MLNIVPINDLEEHEESSTCKCNPKLIEENGELILVHNSFDKREFIERLFKNDS